MRVEATAAKISPLPTGAINVLTAALSKRINQQFPESIHRVSVRYAAANNLTVMGANHVVKNRVTEILQDTWESADDWLVVD
ncbi:DNA damage-inducible protein I [Erwinia tracheiphila]|uniref:Damage-inducible protein I n=1 Tax=Erwinia tracheiphila TaxID=65700 RepID=A0A0M2KFM2_9GAMM|nr:DNA damage-inducible protein I [Erwinia tracheiphila]EOS96656.1 DNA damage-inducible protein I, inhibits UmuD processing [Erwinia tracheiphila PSU-1]KKF37739.1 damage-inducible protein I [Erwinia tracheiphila]UIA86541.1 DNA damage-inducible protein I [Erwinia tracheiphila]UIA94894.1 DNA damage-inducible protein I [Erwinia tracheiphila]